MTVKEWQQAEKFLYDVLPILIMLICIGFMIFVFVLLYANAKKKVMLYVGLATIFLAGGTFYLNHAYADYFDQFAKITPAIRNQRKSLFKVVHYQKEPAKISNQAKIESLGLYDMKPLTGQEEIEYLGATNYLIYFKVNTKLYKLNKDSPYLVYEEGIEKAHFAGNEYQLRDSEFTKVGFYEKISPLYTQLVIPKELAKVTYKHEDGTTESYDFDYHVVKQRE
ncbi:hypothetical protein [Vagococcus salmoninarum]|uniref:hypothetical protein n=1 Tax=Vagococcus salmoninarum TaxID=2739 RepID=UPI0028D401C0|nr:hypothetical protein [Vagococcus salmoninarum]